jgi:alpha-L-fucosidase
MKQNGEGIYDTHPWKRSSLVLDDKTELRFTKKENILYVFLLTAPKNKTFTIPDCKLANGAKAIVVGASNKGIKLVKKSGSVQIELPKELAFTYPLMVKISGLEE